MKRINIELDRNGRLTLALLLFALVPFGCGDETSGANALNLKLYPVKGQVLLQDGKPLASGAVEFVLKNGPAISATGEVGADGSYTLKTEGMGVGAPEGEYHVRIVPSEANYSARTRRNVTAKSIDTKKLGFNLKYLDEDQSKLSAVVKAQDNQLEPFQLTK